MSIGMSYEDYWYASPYLVIAYKKAYDLKRRQINEQMWVQGMYIYEALSVALGNMFGKKGSRKRDYPKEPYDLFNKSDREIQLDAEKERQKAINSLDALKLSMEFKFKGDVENVGNS